MSSRMFQTQIAEKMICMASAIFIFGLLTIFKNDLTHPEAFLIIFLILLIISRYSKKKELKILSAKYENNQQLLSEVFRYCPDAFFVKDLNSKYILCNNSFFKELDIKPEDIIGKGDYVFLDDERAKAAIKYDQLIIKNKETINYDIHYTYNGESKVSNIIKSPIIDNGKVTGILGIARDVTTERALKSTIEEKQLQLTAILNNMPFMAWLKDDESKFLAVNEAFAEICGDTVENIIGKTDFDYFPKDHSELYVTEDNLVMQIKKTSQTEDLIVGPEGTKLHETFKSPVFDDKGNVIGTVGLARDITEIKEIAVQKETFVATLTHDLKVPTVAQIRALELLLKGSMGQLQDEQSEILEQVLNSCKYMLNMISTLLSTYRYDDGIKKIHYEEFDFINLVSECCNEIACLAKEKEQTLLIKNKSTQNLISADRLEIKRVITNLISNAIYYSLNNSPIEISMEEINNEIILLVNSHSQVIQAEILENLFNKYVSNAPKVQNSGLGLYLSKQIITAHNGHIIAESDEINGNTFGFRLPQKGSVNETIKECTNFSAK